MAGRLDIILKAGFTLDDCILCLSSGDSDEFYSKNSRLQPARILISALLRNGCDVNSLIDEAMNYSTFQSKKDTLLSKKDTLQSKIEIGDTSRIPNPFTDEIIDVESNHVGDESTMERSRRQTMVGCPPTTPVPKAELAVAPKKQKIMKNEFDDEVNTCTVTMKKLLSLSRKGEAVAEQYGTSLSRPPTHDAINMRGYSTGEQLEGMLTMQRVMGGYLSTLRSDMCASAASTGTTSDILRLYRFDPDRLVDSTGIQKKYIVKMLNGEKEVDLGIIAERAIKTMITGSTDIKSMYRTLLNSFFDALLPVSMRHTLSLSHGKGLTPLRNTDAYLAIFEVIQRVAGVNRDPAFNKQLEEEIKRAARRYRDNHSSKIKQIGEKQVEAKD